MPLLKQVVESLVFASQKPLVPRDIAVALKAAADESDDPAVQAFGKTREAEIGAVLEEIKLEGSGRAFQLIEQVNGWHFVTSSDYAPWVRQLFPESKPIRLSGPALETLAIIAYRQPVTRAEVEQVRGVNVDGTMQTILERGLAEQSGRAEVVGRPALYSTTPLFLEYFGLRSLDDLPAADELRRIPVEKPLAPVTADAGLATAPPDQLQLNEAPAVPAETSSPAAPEPTQS